PESDRIYRAFRGLSRKLSKYEMGFVNNLGAFALGVGVRQGLDASTRVLAPHLPVWFHPEDISNWTSHVGDNFGLHMLAVGVIGVFFVGKSGFKKFYVLRKTREGTEFVLGESNLLTRCLAAGEFKLNGARELNPDELTSSSMGQVLSHNGLLGYFRVPSLKAQDPQTAQAASVPLLTSVHTYLKDSPVESLHVFHRAVPENVGKLQSFLRDFVFNSAASLVLAKLFSYVGDASMPSAQAFVYAMLMTGMTVTANRIVGEDKKMNDTVVNAMRTVYAIISGAMVKGVASAEGIPVSIKVGAIMLAGALVVAHAVSISSVEREPEEDGA
ncbi:MAG: hypothetical protein ACD_62C00561G0001, partial [uncultured bacterium]